MYHPQICVWELTMGCNMRCKHCGSKCTEPFENELSTEEAIYLCEQLGKLGIKYTTLTGGEPTTRKDLCTIIKKLRENGVIPNIITNGWLIDDEFLDQIIESGIGTFAVSIDGLIDTHDYMRRSNSYNRSMKLLDLLDKKKVYSAVITTVNKRNINELNELYNILVEKKVKMWQIQMAIPMGSFEEQKDLLIDPEQIDDILDFICKTSKEGRIVVYPGDCIGYYTKSEMAVAQELHDGSSVIWQGCPAGKKALAYYVMVIL